MGLFSFLTKDKTESPKPAALKDLDYTKFFHNTFYKTLAENSKSMMIYFYKERGWVGANKTFFEKLGIQDIATFILQHDSLRDTFLSESQEVFTESDQSWIEYIHKYEPDGYRVRMADKEENILEIDVKCHVFASQKNFYILELEDVTELHKTKLKTAEVEELKTNFLANIGHEFRTPMNGILGFIELMGDTNLDKTQREYLSMISSSSKSLMTNIETLLDLSQLQGGRLEVEEMPFNLLPSMETLTYYFFEQGVEKGIKVLMFIDPKLPQEIISDSKKISQIMFSIIQNAIKFTPRGGKVIIEIKLLKHKQNGDCTIGFSVKDTGAGISEEQVSLINEPFTAGGQADERLGVGLSLSNGIVKLLGSELRILSEGGEGTYVSFVLNFKASRGQNFKMMPKKKVKVLLLDKSKINEANFLSIYLRSFSVDVVKSNQLNAKVYDGIDALYIVANQDDSTWMSELGRYSKKAPIILLLDNGMKLQTKLTHIVDDVIAEPLLATTVAKHLYEVNSFDIKEIEPKALSINRRVTALVVEDNYINQRLIKILLQNYNIIVSTASDGVEAVDICEKNRYDIIFMDIDMPEKNGIDATKEIKKLSTANASVPIVALTAMAMDGDREMLLSEGLDDYLSKPLNCEKLESILNKYLKVTT